MKANPDTTLQEFLEKVQDSNAIVNITRTDRRTPEGTIASTFSIHISYANALPQREMRALLESATKAFLRATL